MCSHKVKGVSARSIRSYSRFDPAIRGRPVFEGSANCWLGLKANRGRRERGLSGRTAISDISPWSLDQRRTRGVSIHPSPRQVQTKNLRYRSCLLAKINWNILQWLMLLRGKILDREHYIFYSHCTLETTISDVIYQITEISQWKILRLTNNQHKNYCIFDNRVPSKCLDKGE